MATKKTVFIYIFPSNWKNNDIKFLFAFTSQKVDVIHSPICNIETRIFRNLINKHFRQISFVIFPSMDHSQRKVNYYE